jgi:hypothetical protein
VATPEQIRRRGRWSLIVGALLAALSLATVSLASDADVSVADVTAPTGSVTLAAGASGPIDITVNVTGNQLGTATFEVYRDWTLSGGTFTGSNPFEFTVDPRAPGDPADVFTTSGTVSVASGQTNGTFTLLVGIFDVTNTNATGAKLGSTARTLGSYSVTVATPSDTTPPVVNVSTQNSVPTSGWFTTSPQQVNVSAYDPSGVTNLECSVDGAAYAAAASQSGAGTSAASPRTGTVSVSGDGEHTVVCRATDGASPANTGAAPGSTEGITVKIDTTPPSISLLLNESDAYTHVNGSTVYYNDQSTNSGSFSVSATAADTVSGVAKVNFPNVFDTDGGDDTSSGYSNTYNWTATENVSGSKTVTAYNGAGLTNTASFTVTRDIAGPTGVAVNGVTNGASYVVGSTLPTGSCAAPSDAGSGVATSSTTPTQTPNLNSNGVGTVVYTCTATDNVGNTTTASVTVNVVYGICLLYDQTKSHKAGSTVPLKIYLCNASGTNLSSAGIVVTATLLKKLDNSASSSVEDSGYANPESNFRFDESLTTGGGYIFNLSTKSPSPALGPTTALGTGTWKLWFSVDGVGGYSIQFDIK